MVKKFKECFKEIVFFVCVISDLFPSVGFGENSTEYDYDDVDEFMKFAGVVTARVF